MLSYADVVGGVVVDSYGVVVLSYADVVGGVVVDS